MHGAGNDFIVVDNRDQSLSVEDIIKLAPGLCHRRFGIGADGILALQPAENYDENYTMVYRNADGSDAGMCGNGARCLALFAAHQGLGNDLQFNVHKTKYRATVQPENNYVEIAFPIKTSVDKVLLAERETTTYQIYAGTEHVVLETNKKDFENDEKLVQKGRQLRYHEQFNPPGTNVNFIQAMAPSKIKIKTYEKGVENLTLACGTGAVAAAIGWHHIQQLNDEDQYQVEVQADGGLLTINFKYNSANNTYFDITLGGQAEFVFQGKIAIDKDDVSFQEE